MSENQDYVSFHNHTTFSLMDSLIRPSDLFKKAKELGQSAIAVTEHSSLACAWDCLKYSREAGVKLIIGCEFYFVDDVKNPDAKIRHVILTARNYQGYKNLLKLNFEGFQNKQVLFKKVVPRIDWDLLKKYSEGLICTTACGGGILAQLINTRKIDEAREQAKRLKSIFGEYLAIEIQPHSMKRTANLYKDYEDQRFTNYQLVKIGQELDIKVIAATDAHYPCKEDHEAHDVMLAIGSGQPITSGNRLRYSNDFWIKSRDEVLEGLRAQPALRARAEEFCDNTLIFAAMCEEPNWIDPKYSNPSGKELPEFPVKDQTDYQEFLVWRGERIEYDQKQEDTAYLRYWCEKNFDRKVPTDKHIEYRARLEEEFDVIEFHGFSSYLLIVADYIDWCRKNSIRVGPGRGSFGGSLIGYLTDAHQADPIKYNLIFARFHNKEKTSFPDVDTDFAPSGRDRLHTYIRNKYGDDKVAHVSNIITIKPKVYAKDIARTFQFGGDLKAAVAVGAAIADSIPDDITDLEDALANAPLFAEYANSEKYGALKKYAAHLGGKSKAWATHAAGLVIGKRPLIDFVPLRMDKDDSISVEYDKDRAEANGLVKMDTLGLMTLDIITDTYRLIEQNGKEVPPDPPDFNEYDEKTYGLLARGDNLCVFQLGGSGGTIDLCKKIKPRTIEDISIINALARPSAKDIREPLIAVRDGREPLNILHPSLQRAFGGTYGFGLYEECLMFLAQDVAGWDLHEADRLRKLTKEKGKNPKKVAQWRTEFIEGSVKNEVGEEMGAKIWDEVVDAFQGYGFNLSHSILYSMISYHTAYLKAHFPLEFLTANLMAEAQSNTPKSKDKINLIKTEIRKLKITIVPPDINLSDTTYKILDEKTLMTGLDALKFMGKDAIPEIVAKRPFSSFEDFLLKVDGRKVRSTAVQALAGSGALDSFKISRKQAYLHAADYKKKLQLWTKRKNKGPNFDYPWPEDKSDWNFPEKFAMERFYLGEGLSANKFQAYAGFFTSQAPRFSDYPKLFPNPGTSDQKYELSTFYGEVKGFFEFKVKKENSKSFGELMSKVFLEDPHGNPMTMTVFPKQWKELKSRFSFLSAGKGKIEFGPGVAISATGSLNWYEGDISIVFDELLRCAPPPPLPTDLKARKVNMKTLRAPKNVKDIDAEELLEEIEEELVEEGLSFLEEDDLFPTDDDEDEILDGFNI